MHPSPDNSNFGNPADNILDASIRAVSHCPRLDNSLPDLTLVVFSVELPAAARVQLAADFTDWDKFPLDMARFENDVWSTTVPLPAGIYAYRFLADGKWYDDLHAIWHDPSGKAFVRVE